MPSKWLLYLRFQERNEASAAALARALETARKVGPRPRPRAHLFVRVPFAGTQKVLSQHFVIRHRFGETTQRRGKYFALPRIGSQPLHGLFKPPRCISRRLILVHTFLRPGLSGEATDG